MDFSTSEETGYISKYMCSCSSLPVRVSRQLMYGFEERFRSISRLEYTTFASIYDVLTQRDAGWVRGTANASITNSSIVLTLPVCYVHMISYLNTYSLRARVDLREQIVFLIVSVLVLVIKS